MSLRRRRYKLYILTSAIVASLIVSTYAIFLFTQFFPQVPPRSPIQSNCLNLVTNTTLTVSHPQLVYFGCGVSMQMVTPALNVVAATTAVPFFSLNGTGYDKLGLSRQSSTGASVQLFPGASVSLSAGQYIYIANYTGAVNTTAFQVAWHLPPIAPAVQLRLVGDFVKGWNGTTPGPKITIRLSDTVRFSFISGDGVTHDFFIDYNGNKLPDANEPKSPNFSSTTQPISFDFTPTQTGTYTYYCEYHSTTMYGTIVITS